MSAEQILQAGATWHTFPENKIIIISSNNSSLPEARQYVPGTLWRRPANSDELVRLAGENEKSIWYADVDKTANDIAYFNNSDFLFEEGEVGVDDLVITRNGLLFQIHSWSAQREQWVANYRTSIVGPQGIQGIQGVPGPTGERGSKWYSIAGSRLRWNNVDGCAVLVAGIPSDLKVGDFFLVTSMYFDSDVSYTFNKGDVFQVSQVTPEVILYEVTNINGPSGIYWVQYGTTSYLEINNAVTSASAPVLPVINFAGQLFYLDAPSAYYSGGNKARFCTLTGSLTITVDTNNNYSGPF